METDIEKSIFSPRPAPKASPPTSQDRENICEDLRSLIANGEIERSPNFATLLAIIEQEETDVCSGKIYMSIIKNEGAEAIELLEQVLRRKGKITEAIEHRAAEILEQFRD